MRKTLCNLVYTMQCYKCLGGHGTATHFGFPKWEPVVGGDKVFITQTLRVFLSKAKSVQFEKG